MKREFERYCKNYQDIENYEAAKKDNFKGWNCHHRLETHTSDGERRLVNISTAELQALRMYYNRPAEELIFLTSREHRLLHNEGENNPNYGKPAWNKGKHHTEETRKKMREAMKGKNRGNIATKGRHWYNNGKENKYCYECPDGFIPGRLRK